MDIFDWPGQLLFFVAFPITRFAFHFLLSLALLGRDIFTIVKYPIIGGVHIYVQKPNEMHDWIPKCKVYSFQSISMDIQSTTRRF
jgi:hypothetical protein